MGDKLFKEKACDLCGKDAGEPFEVVLGVCTACSLGREQIMLNATLGAKVREAVLAECPGERWHVIERVRREADRDGATLALVALEAIADALEAESKPVEIDGFEEAE